MASRLERVSHISLAGFGLGALNDADEDDLDIYEGGSSNLRSRLAYDAADDHDGETIPLGKSKSNLVGNSSFRTRRFDL